MTGVRLRSTAAWVLQILLAVLFTIQAVVKLSGSPVWIARFHAWGYPEHFYLMVGMAELLGAILLLIPRLASWGALLLMAVMAGATATHLLHHEPQVRTALVLFAALAVVLYLRSRAAGKSAAKGTGLHAS